MKFFELFELVDKKTYETLGNKAWDLFKPEALIMLEGLREFFKCPISCNTWHWGGEFQFRGYRPPSCSVGAPQSLHKQGMAFDVDIEGLSAEEARLNIMADQNNPLLKNIMRMEKDTNWVHIDCKPVANRIYLFQP